MFDVFKELATDPSKELNGTWFDIGQGARILVARSSNRAYAKALTKAVELNRELLAGEDEAAVAKNDSIMIELFSTTILLGFEGISFKGEAMAYSVANAALLLAVADFRALVARKSNEFDAYRVTQDAAQGKA